MAAVSVHWDLFEGSELVAESIVVLRDARHAGECDVEDVDVLDAAAEHRVEDHVPGLPDILLVGDADGYVDAKLPVLAVVFQHRVDDPLVGNDHV